MSLWKRYLHNLGIEDWIFGLSGLGAIVLSVLGFLQVWPFGIQPTLQVIVGAIGVLMLAIVAQTSRRREELREFQEALGVAEIEIMGSGREFGHDIFRSASQTKHFILNSFLNASTPLLTKGYGFSGSQAEVHRLIYRRVIQDEIEFRLVVVIFHKEMLEDTLFKLLLHEGHKFFIRYYESPPKVIPVLDMISFDDEKFYLGAYHTSASPGTTPRVSIREARFSEMLKSYWRIHWENAIPLNVGGVIDWNNLKEIGSKLGLSDEEFNTTIDKVKSEVQRIRHELSK